jgi:hemerythrin
MTGLTQFDATTLHFAPMDDLHHQFMRRLDDVIASSDSALAEKWLALIQTAEQVFGQENTWMVDTHFAHTPRHTLQHKVVLNVMREGLALARRGQLSDVRNMSGELAHWFTKHTLSADVPLAHHMLNRFTRGSHSHARSP